MQRPRALALTCDSPSSSQHSFTSIDSITALPQSRNVARTTLVTAPRSCRLLSCSGLSSRGASPKLHDPRRTDSLIRGHVCRSLLWDATVLYGLTEPITETTIEAVENYYLTWWNGGMAVKMFMHIVVRPPTPPSASEVVTLMHCTATDARLVLLPRRQVGTPDRVGFLLYGRLDP
jgi:hypothetical protein